MTQGFWDVTLCCWVNHPSWPAWPLQMKTLQSYQKCQEPLSQQQSITFPEDNNVRNLYLATKFLSSVLSEHMREQIYTQHWVTQNILWHLA